jgi:hypothetical protein
MAGLREQPLGDVLGQLARESQGLVQEELRLARAELRAELDHAKKAGVQLGAGGAVAYVALFLLGATLILAGATFLPAWLSALIVTAVYAAVGGALIARGRTELERAGPSRAMERIKEDGRWAKETMRDVASTRGARA